ncbi:hypothetical protein F8388_012958, partial [Cannabis sativa]
GEALDGDSGSTSSQTLISPTGLEPITNFAKGNDGQYESEPPINRAEILKALEVVERDSIAISESFASLFASLRVALSGVMLDSATKGNRYINSCLRLNEEMNGVDNLATQLKILRRNVDVLDSAVNKLLRIP